MRVGQSPRIRKGFIKRCAWCKKPYSLSSLGFGPIVCTRLPRAERSPELWLWEMLWPSRRRVGKAHDAHSGSLCLCPSVAWAELLVHPSVPPPLRGRAASEHGQVVAGLGAGLERPAARAAGCQACQEATSSLTQAGPPSGRGRFSGAAVSTAQAQLAHHTLEEFGHVVLQRG